MRRLPALLALVLLSTLVVGSAAQAETTVKKLNFEVMSYTRITEPHDLPPKGRENKGDYIIYRNLLVSVGPLFGKEKFPLAVGYETGTLTYLSATVARIRGKMTFQGQGTILIRGKMKDLPNGSTTVPVVGGTGKFSRASGVLIVGPGSTKALNTFRLKLSGPITA
jgi:hypothetical protein